MSWGERSCKKCTAPENYCQIQTCNVDCPWYQWDGITKPDSVKAIPEIKHKPSVEYPYHMNRADRRKWLKENR